MKLVFCKQINIKVSYDFKTLGTKGAYKVILLLLLGMIKYSQSTQSNKFAVSLRYLKKEFRKGVQFLHADEHQSFYKLGLLFLMKVARHVQSIQNTKLVIFLQRVFQLLFVFYCDPKHSDILRGSSHVCCYLFPCTARLQKVYA